MATKDMFNIAKLTKDNVDIEFISDGQGNLLWESYRSPLDLLFYSTSAKSFYQFDPITETWSTTKKSFSASSNFTPSNIVPEPGNNIWHYGWMFWDTTNRRLEFKRIDGYAGSVWSSAETPTVFQGNFNPSKVWYGSDRYGTWHYSDGNIQYYYDPNAEYPWKTDSHLDADGNPFYPDTSGMWCIRSTLYQSINNTHYKLALIDVGGTFSYRWVQVSFTGITNFDVNNVWTDGKHTFYGHEYKLKESTNTWEAFTFNINVDANEIITNGKHTYARFAYDSTNKICSYLKWDRLHMKWVEFSKSGWAPSNITGTNIARCWTDAEKPTDNCTIDGYYRTSLYKLGVPKVTGRYTTFWTDFTLLGL